MFHHLQDYIKKGGDIVSVSSAKTLCEKIRGFSEQVFPSLKSHVSSYTFRHNFAAEAKATLGADGAAVCLGHSNAFYSRARQSGSFKINSVKGSRPVKHILKNNLNEILHQSQILSM